MSLSYVEFYSTSYVCCFRQVIILDPVLIKAGTKEMREKSEQLQKHVTGLDRHNALLQYYTESSTARLKAVWYIHMQYLYVFRYKSINRFN